MGKDATSFPPSLDLGGGLVLKTAEDAQDVERIAELHGQAFDPTGATFTRVLAAGYPGLQPRDFAYVEDTATGEVVSSICLVPTRWRYEGVTLEVGELGIVGTHPDYRRRGLVRALMGWFESELQARGCHLASIQGILYFYRQFGYEYIIPMGYGYQLSPEQVPEALEADADLEVRLAGPSDIPLLLEFLAGAQAALGVSVERSAEVWRYQDDPARDDEDALDTYLTLDKGRPTGYFRVYRHEMQEQDRQGVVVCEASLLPYRSSLAALRRAKELAAGRRHLKAIRISLPASSPLTWMAAYLGGQPHQPYAWQVRIPDAVRFLKRIAPVLEQRLAASFLAGYNSFLRIDLYTDTIELDWREGRLVDVCSLGPLESRAVRLPWWVAWQLWLGHRSREELTAWYPDARVEQALQPLIDVLFPKRESWVFPTL
jgi:predicted N-acetyltransferase YhbS